MSDKTYEKLDARGLIAVEGPDAKPFLQGLVSNDVNKIAPGRAVYAAFLTAQGKYLHDFFLAQQGEALLIDCEAARLADFKKRLTLYKLRSKVSIAEKGADVGVYALMGANAAGALGLAAEAGAAGALGSGVAFVDPRLAEAGARAILPVAEADALLSANGFAKAEAGAYDRLRLSLGLPDGSRDLEIEKSILLENGFDELNGIDWDKGCYMGQELTARTKYRGLIKKRLVPVEIEGPVPPAGTPIMLDGSEVGEMRSGQDGLGLALIRLEHMEKAPFVVGDARVTPKKPRWAAF